MRTNRRRWFAHAAACTSAASALEIQLAGESPGAPQLPARSDFPIAEAATFLNNAAWHPLSSGPQARLRLICSGSPPDQRGFPLRPPGTR